MCCGALVLLICVRSVLGSVYEINSDCDKNYVIRPFDTVFAHQSTINIGHSRKDTSQEIIVKSFSNERNEKFEIEMEVMSKLTEQQQNAPDSQKAWFPKLYDVCRFKSREGIMEPSIVMEYVTYSLSQVKKSLSNLVEMLRQLFSAADQLHQTGFTHNDINENNVRVARDGTLKLFDFDFAEHINKPLKGKVIRGTPNKIPPERMLINSYLTSPTTLSPPNIDTAKLDSWPLGILAFNILTDTHLFKIGKNVEMENCLLGDTDTNQWYRANPYYATYFHFKSMLSPGATNSAYEELMLPLDGMGAKVEKCLPEYEATEDRFKTGFKNKFKAFDPNLIENMTNLWDLVKSLLQIENSMRSDARQVLENPVFQRMCHLRGDILISHDLQRT